MNYRTTTLLALKDLGLSGAEPIEINLAEKIAQLHFSFYVLKGAGHAIASPLDALSKIEILDGSNKLLEVTGTQLAGIQFFDTGKIGTAYLRNTASVAHWCFPVLHFGRFPYDPLYNFDPTKFTNPQIRVTFNAALAQANATKVFLKVIADVFDEKDVTPVGFMRNNTVKIYNASTGTFDYTDLPTDLEIRKLIIQSKRYAADMKTLIAEAKLSEDNDKRVPFDMTIAEIVQMDNTMYPKIEQVADFTTSAGGHFIFAAPTDEPVITGFNISGIRAVQQSVLFGNRFAIATANATDWVRCRLSGDLPWQMVCFPFGVQDDPDDWYKVGNIGSLRLRIKGGTAAGGTASISVLLQQIYKYAA